MKDAFDETVTVDDLINKASESVHSAISGNEKNPYLHVGDVVNMSMERIQSVYKNVEYPKRLVSCLAQNDFIAAKNERAVVSFISVPLFSYGATLKTIATKFCAIANGTMKIQMKMN